MHSVKVEDAWCYLHPLCMIAEYYWLLLLARGSSIHRQQFINMYLWPRNGIWFLTFKLNSSITWNTEDKRAVISMHINISANISYYFWFALLPIARCFVSSPEPILVWASSWENLFLPYANNKGADQHAHPCNLISAFLVHCLDSIKPILG